MDGQSTSITITTGTIVKITLLLALFWLLYTLRDLALILLTAIVLASAIEPPTRWLTRYRIPRIIAVLLVFTIFLLVFFGLFYFFVPVVLDEVIHLTANLPAYLEAFDGSDLFGSEPLFGGAAGTFSAGDIIAQIRLLMDELTTNAVGAISMIFGGLSSFIFIVVFSFYFAAQERGIKNFLRIITPVKNQPYVIDLWERSQNKIGLWMQGQLLLGLIVGILVYLGLTVLGVPYALILAVLAAVFELIPIFGPILAAVPAVAIAFIDGGVTMGLLVVALYVIIQQFESHLIYPLVVTKVVGVPPLLVILSLIVGAKLAGFLGIILSVPVAAALQELVGDLDRRRWFVFGEEEPREQIDTNM